MNTDQSIIDRCMKDSKNCYITANTYYRQDRLELAKLWELAASYYQILAYESDPYELLGEFNKYGEFESLVEFIHNTLEDSLPRNVSRKSMGGFGYHGNTPIGYSWGIVYSIAPNVAEIYQESNWDIFIAELDKIDPESENYTIERFGSWITPTENLMIRLIDDNGYPTDAAILAHKLVRKLEDHPYLDEDNVSERESDQDYIEQIDSIRSAANDLMLIDTLPDNLNGLVWEWLYENDHEVIERNARGYSDSGYIDDNAPIYCALYCMGYIDLEYYDSDELAALEDQIESYIWQGITRAFSGYHAKL